MSRVKPAWLDGPQRPCTRCGRPTFSTAAVPMHRACGPRAAPRPPTTWAERKRRAAFLEAYIAEIGGPWCPGWRREGHWATSGNPLTADHITSVAQSGNEGGELQPLCNRCNASKRAKSGRVQVSRRVTRMHQPSPARTPAYPPPSGTC